MKFQVHPWPRRQNVLENLSWIDTDNTVEVEILPGRYIAEVSESVLYSELDGTYFRHDDQFLVEGVEKYEQYPLVGRCKKHPVQTTAWFLLVADRPFTVTHRFMVQDSATWGHFDSPMESYQTEAQLVTA